MLVWDNYKCHISADTKRHTEWLKLAIVFVPGGCTKYIQVADVSWSKPIKDKVTECYDAWMELFNKIQYILVYRTFSIPLHETITKLHSFTCMSCWCSCNDGELQCDALLITFVATQLPVSRYMVMCI